MLIQIGLGQFRRQLRHQFPFHDTGDIAFRLVERVYPLRGTPANELPVFTAHKPIGLRTATVHYHAQAQLHIFHYIIIFKFCDKSKDNK